MALPTTKQQVTKKPELKIYRVHENVEIPKVATEQSACFDIKFNPEGKTTYTGWNSNNKKFERNIINNKIRIMPGDRVMIPTGIIFDIPEGFSVRVHARSGLSLKSGIVLANSEGVIDSDYIDEFYVLLLNTSNNAFDVSAGDRIAQAEMVPLLDYDIVDSKKTPTTKTSRKGGMGSTGVSDGASTVSEATETPAA